MPLKFDDDLQWDGPSSDPTARAKVDAAGPLTDGATMKEICVWVYQRNGGNDAAATEMSTLNPPALDRSVPGRWSLELTQISDTPLRNAPAFGVAVALLLDSSGNEQIVWWGHPLRLVPRTVAKPGTLAGVAGEASDSDLAAGG